MHGDECKSIAESRAREDFECACTKHGVTVTTYLPQCLPRVDGEAEWMLKR